MIPLDRIVVILVEPRTPGNIGMICRAMANFGASELRLVNPCQYLHPEAHKFAVFASELLGAARTFPDLESAIADLQMNVAATRRSGRLRGELIPLSEAPRLVQRLAPGERIGLVFGREDSGLTTDEVALCSHAATIASDPERGSLNLAQAVMVFLYEFAREEPPRVADTRERPRQEEIEAMFVQAEEVLGRIAFVNSHCPERVMNPLRRLFHRVDLDRSELSLLRGMWSQISWSIRDWKGRKRG
jgi:tRNA/rRNA methyltransferase